METVKNNTEWYLIYQDGVEYHILDPDEVKQMKAPKKVGSGFDRFTAELNMRKLMGEQIRCIYPTTGETFIW